MTRETALRALKSILAEINESENAVCYLTSEDSEAIELAIKALEQEPCEDCVSRESVNRLINLGWNKGIYPSGAIRALPSVKPTAQKGHWISRWYKDKHFHVCSECQEEFSYDAETGIEITDYHICPNCGARMSEVSE